MKSTGVPDQTSQKSTRKILIGRLIDGTGTRLTENILMTVKEGRILEMHPFHVGETTPKDLWLDLSAFTVLPPLFDCHVHLALSGSIDPARKVNPLHLAYESIFPDITRHIQANFRHGVLGVRDGGDPLGHVLRYKQEGSVPKKNMVQIGATGCAWYREGRYGKLIGRPVPAGKEAAVWIDRKTGDGVDHIKLIQSGLNSLSQFGRETPPQFDEEDIEKIYAIARNRGISLMIHANGEMPVAVATAGGCDSIEHGYFMGDENLRKIADVGITWVPTAIPMKALAEHSPKGRTEHEVAQRTLEHQLGQLSKAREYGIAVALGSDAGSPGVHHGKAVSQELALFVAAGYTPEEAIRCGSLNAAQLMGADIPGYLGSGTPATFIVLKGKRSNILQQLKKIEMMVVSGEIVEVGSGLS